jgi:alkylhydroperoxidase family enzyme
VRGGSNAQGNQQGGTDCAAQDDARGRDVARSHARNPARGGEQDQIRAFGQVSRLPPLTQPLDPIMQEMFAKHRVMGGSVINLQLVTGHAPKFSRAAAAMAFTIRFGAVTPRRLLELAILRTAEIVGSDYEVNQHRPLMTLCGDSDAQIAAVAAWRGSVLFDDKQRAVLGYVKEMAHGGDVKQAAFAALAQSRRRRSSRSPIRLATITATDCSPRRSGLKARRTAGSPSPASADRHALRRWLEEFGQM